LWKASGRRVAVNSSAMKKWRTSSDAVAREGSLYGSCAQRPRFNLHLSSRTLPVWRPHGCCSGRGKRVADSLSRHRKLRSPTFANFPSCDIHTTSTTSLWARRSGFSTSDMRVDAPGSVTSGRARQGAASVFSL
jgi:hypothetical protein